MRLLKLIAPAALAVGLASTSFAQTATPEAQSAAATASPAKRSVIPSAAATYATFQGDIGEIGAKPLSSQAEIEQKLDALGGHNPGKLTNGWMSYSALVAAQNREFAASVRDIDSYYGKFREDYLSNQDIYYNADYYDQYMVYHAETSLYCIL